MVTLATIVVWLLVLATTCLTTATAFQLPDSSTAARSIANSIVINRRRLSSAFAIDSKKTPTATTVLYMGKGLNKAKNKQAALMQKMKQAKKQRREEGETDGTEEESLSDEEIKEQNDRKRFEQLLQDGGNAVVYNDYGTDEYLSMAQVEEEVKAAKQGIERLFEGDPAPSKPFEALVSIQTNQALGKEGIKQLLPWNNNNKDYLVVVTDPRPKSLEMREAITSLMRELSPGIKDKLIFINADTPAENRKFIKKNLGTSNSPTIYCDQDLEWMREYTALGLERWSMTMFVMGNNGRVEKLGRELEAMDATISIQNAVNSLL